MSSGGRRELRLIRIRRSTAPVTDVTNRETSGFPQRSADARPMVAEAITGDVPLDDIRRMMNTFVGPPPTPAEVSPSQVSPSHPAQQGNRGRGRGWFSSLQLLRRRGRSRRQPLAPPPAHSHILDPLHLSPYAGDLASTSTQDGSLGTAEREVASPSFFRPHFPRASVHHVAEAAEDGFWVFDDTIWMNVDVENDTREMEAAYQSIIMDGLGGALHARGRRRPHRLWLSDADEDMWTYEELLELDANNVKRGLKQKEFNTLERSQQRCTDPLLDCQICMSETCTGDQIVKLPCSHSYHEACITPWLICNRTCPVCRYEFPG